MIIYKYICRGNKMWTVELEAANHPNGYTVQKGTVRLLLKKDDIGRIIGDKPKQVYLLERNDMLAAFAFKKFKQRNLEELQNIAEKLKENIAYLKEAGG